MPAEQPLYAIGVDIGATKIAAALVGRDGQVLSSRQALTQVEQGTPAMLERIAGEINALLRESAGLAQPLPLKGIGIGTPGKVIAAQGLVLNAINMGWERLNLVDEVRARLAVDLPVWIEKDANASALGEYYYGAARGCEHFVYLGVGSGLGCGLLVDGRLVTGFNGKAGEAGHISLDPQGLLCACGQRGCAETLASGPGLVNAARRILEQRRSAASRTVTGGLRPAPLKPGRLKTGPLLTAAGILAAAQEGDGVALAALEAVGRALGVVAAACVALLNPQRIVIGGGLGVAAFKYLEPALWAELEQRTLAICREGLELAPSQLASPAVGAACLAWYGGGSGTAA
ncbi:MAG: ROK family protein [Chloroflexota bacterium]